jgi:thioredoxin reductase (NADPH)
MDDCAIIGAGPAGLTAALYLARFGLSVRLYDSGRSRAATIPCTRNAPGFPEGISGRDLLARMRDHALRYGVRHERSEVSRLARAEGGFRLNTGGGETAARSVLLATGIVNHRPQMPNDLHDEAVARGLIRYCPICDGFEVTDKRVAVIGTGDHGTREALFLRSYTRDLMLVSFEAESGLSPDCERQLDDAGVERLHGPCGGWAIEGDRIGFDTARGRVVVDSVYPAMGSLIRSELAVAAGARATDEGCLEVDDHQRTSVPGLFAAGDVVKGLDQISHAVGEAGVAATAIRNHLAEQRPLRR